ncbi:TIR-like protein FxsC [Dactylosporangium sp. CS-033363]|uniref:TIR-like protein FxsC n=1 Tax=Dactylosporangium sp. CS-033363 TaxID=3239935 RepID=UPI003D94446F
MTDDIATILNLAGIPFDRDVLLDVLWLARRLPTDENAPLVRSRADKAARAGGSAELPERTGRGRSGSEKITAPTDRPVDDLSPTVPVYAAGPDQGDNRSAMRLPARSALGRQLAFGKALRPLKRKVSSIRRSVLDEARTAEQLAEIADPATGRFLPHIVLAAAAERWLRVNMVIDGEDSMIFWQQHTRELHSVIERMGAFQRVDVHQLHRDARSGAVSLVRPWSGAAARRPAKSIIDPARRAMTLVLTDGASPAWRDGTMRRALDRWGSTGPTAVVHVLPPRLWPGSGVPAEEFDVSSSRPGLANTGWDVTDPLFPFRAGHAARIPVPVLSLTPESLATWAQLVIGGGGPKPMPLWLLPSHPAVESVSASSFTRLASASAVRIAAHLAAIAPSTIPAMWLVHACVGDGTDATTLAEVFLSGLLHPVQPQPLQHARHRLFDFEPQDKDFLLDLVPTDSLNASSRKVGERIQALHGRSTDFPTWLTPRIANGAFTRPVQPLAEVHERMLAPQPPFVVSTGPSSTGASPRTAGPMPTRPAINLRYPPLPQATAAPYFFLSYARSDDDQYVEQFFKDLSGEVRVRAGLGSAKTVGFLDRNLEMGTIWSKELVDALATCTTFIGLCSPRYIASEPCGQEWQLFAQRCEQYELDHGRRSTALVPALWLPPRHLPEAVRRVQFDQERFGEAYRRGGLRQLMRLARYHDEYLEAISVLAQHIVDNAEVDRLPPLAPADRTNFDAAPSAFHAEIATEKTPAFPKHEDVHFIIAAPTRGEALAVRGDVSCYGDQSLDWMPYAPTHTTPLAGYAREVAARRGLTSRASAISLDPLAGRASESATIVVLLVDAWASQLETYRRAVGRHEDLHGVTAALVPRNIEDAETEQHWRLLSDGMRSMFLDRIASRDPLVYRQDILTHRAFDEDLQVVLETARNRAFTASRLAGPTAPARRPGTLEGP